MNPLIGDRRSAPPPGPAAANGDVTSGAQSPVHGAANAVAAPAVDLAGSEGKAAAVGGAPEAAPVRTRSAPTVGLAMPQFAAHSMDPVVEEEEFFAQLKRKWSNFLVDMRDPFQRTTMITIGFLAALLVYSYLPGLTNAYIAWANPQYALSLIHI